MRPFRSPTRWRGPAPGARLPGECEGDLACSVGWLARTDVRYLALHPRGAHAGTALSNVAVFLDGAVEDPHGAGALSGAPAEDLARLNRDLAALALVALLFGVLIYGDAVLRKNFVLLLLLAGVPMVQWLRALRALVATLVLRPRGPSLPR